MDAPAPEARKRPSPANPNHNKRPRGGGDEPLVRLLLRTLHDLDFPEAARALEQESRVALFPDAVLAFRAAVGAGDWPGAAELARNLRLREPGAAGQQRVRCELFKAQFMELLEAGDAAGAVRTLQRDLGALAPAERHRLAAQLLLPSSSLEWAGRAGVSRTLDALLSSEQLVPAGRLQELLRQAQQRQADLCPHHNNGGVASEGLFEDHVCPPEVVPQRPLAVLEAHTDEVWCAVFSPSGRLLATAGKDRRVLVWDLLDPSAPSVVVAVPQAVAAHGLSWNPSETELLSCAQEPIVRRWSAASGEALAEYDGHLEPVSAAQWAASDDLFVTGGLDRRVVLWRVRDGSRLWVHEGPRVSDLVVTCDGLSVVACSERVVTVLSLAEGVEEPQRRLEEKALITSLTVAEDGHHVLLNTSASTVNCWDLASGQQVGAFADHKQTRYVLRSCFGGTAQGFVASGSEDALVYIWSRGSQRLIATLRGHTGVVNDVAWHPTNPRLLVSASDDGTVRVWG